MLCYNWKYSWIPSNSLCDCYDLQDTVPTLYKLSIQVSYDCKGIKSLQTQINLITLQPSTGRKSIDVGQQLDYTTE